MQSVSIAVVACLLLSSVSAVAHGLTLDSASVKADGWLSAKQESSGHGCAGGNISPALSWSGAPADTKSFAVTLFDPDARAGQGWWHWVVINIPSTVHALSEDAGNGSGTHLPLGAIQVRTSFGDSAYGGACPPVGDKPHRYVFTVYAMKVAKIDLAASASAASANLFINANALDRATLVARYGR
ncbi:MAG: YbhB/YbcL family Raf kinase inhibitor-like protein [Proteobacteria bacterium]|nr:YbhB/YbcL family Raf kinase inhibitor-like protein [Pseudomonadota bacterium]